MKRIPTFTANDVREYMRNRWDIYASDSHLGIRLEFSASGEFRVTYRKDAMSDRETVYQGADLEKAIDVFYSL